MVTEWLLSAMFTVIRFILDRIPAWTPPTWVTNIPGQVAEISDAANNMSAWIPFGALANVAIVVVAGLGIALTIKVVRIVASFFTAGGGSAG